MQGEGRLHDLREFRVGLKTHLTDPHSRPFVCTGSPLECRAFIVGLNAATRLLDASPDAKLGRAN